MQRTNYEDNARNIPFMIQDSVYNPIDYETYNLVSNAFTNTF